MRYASGQNVVIEYLLIFLGGLAILATVGLYYGHYAFKQGSAPKVSLYVSSAGVENDYNEVGVYINVESPSTAEVCIDNVYLEDLQDKYWLSLQSLGQSAIANANALNPSFPVCLEPGTGGLIEAVFKEPTKFPPGSEVLMMIEYTIMSSQPTTANISSITTVEVVPSLSMP